MRKPNQPAKSIPNQHANFMNYFNQHFWSQQSALKEDDLLNYLKLLSVAALQHKKYYERQNSTKNYSKDCVEERYQFNPLWLINAKMQAQKKGVKRHRFHAGNIPESEMEKFYDKYNNPGLTPPS